jgi:AraC-like DNA-binding protein
MNPSPTGEKERPGRRDRDILRALDLLAGSEEQFPTQVELAEEVGLSPSQFARRFQKAVGMNFRAYLSRERLNRARRRLEEGLSVKEAAIVAGYSEVSQFSRAFRREFGLRPSRCKGGP